MATWKMISFQDAMSPIMEQLIMFHDHTMMILMMITVMVMYMLLSMSLSKLINRSLLEGQLTELIWTMLPAMLLIAIALPSLKTLYLLEEMSKPLVTLKAIGHQWYWSYEYSDYKKIEFDSYMKNSTFLEKGELRLLEVDNRIMLPYNVQSRILVTSYDVIHSWTIPSIGIKVDGSPGRINQGKILMMRPGVLYGQCSEICGANHSFMPIVIESVSTNSFNSWIQKF